MPCNFLHSVTFYLENIVSSVQLLFKKSYFHFSPGRKVREKSPGKSPGESSGENVLGPFANVGIRPIPRCFPFFSWFPRSFNTPTLRRPYPHHCLAGVFIPLTQLCSAYSPISTAFINFPYIHKVSKFPSYFHSIKIYILFA